MRLLILDDDPSCTEAMAQYFAARGYDLEVASALEEAQLLLSRRSFDAVITDIRLSNLQQSEGLLLLGFIREHALQTRVMVVTAYDVSDIREEAMRLGAEHFFVKPASQSRRVSPHPVHERRPRRGPVDHDRHEGAPAGDAPRHRAHGSEPASLGAAQTRLTPRFGLA